MNNLRVEIITNQLFEEKEGRIDVNKYNKI
jgi:hypothetical protein